MSSLDEQVDEAQAALDRAAEERFAGFVHDANDLDDIPEPVPLIDGLLDAGTVAVLAGKFGTYKTFLALAWSASLATGQPWATFCPREPAPVIYVAAEGAASVRRRLAAWRKFHGDIPPGMLTVVSRPVRLTVPDDVTWVRELVDMTEARLVVFDTLHRCAPGAEENSSTEMGRVHDEAAALRDETGCTVLLVHHTGHAGERSRGTSSIEDDADTAYVVKLAGDDEDRSAANPRVLRNRKQKDRELVEPQVLTFTYVPEVNSGVVDVALLTTAEEAGEDRIAALVRAADAADIPWNLASRPLYKALNGCGKQVSVREAEQVAKLRKARGGKK